MQREQTGDVTFVVESERIRAHRLILAGLSPKYKAQFYGPSPDDGEIRIADVSAAAFREFLEFFYKENVKLTMENIETVLDLAKQSLNDDFVDVCSNFLKNAMTTNNLCVAYRLAIMYDMESLRFDCAQQISAKTTDLFASDDFLRCDRDVLMSILKLDTMNCSEVAMFNACIAWARADCTRKGLDESMPENLRASLGDAIYQIRFASMNAEEFAMLHKSLDGFFTPDEVIEFLYVIGKLKDFEPRMFTNTAIRKLYKLPLRPQSTIIIPKRYLFSNVSRIPLINNQ